LKNRTKRETPHPAFAVFVTLPSLDELFKILLMQHYIRQQAL